MSPFEPDTDPAPLPKYPDAEYRLPSALSVFFAVNRPVTFGQAPGRLDVMGGIADYSGSLVLQIPIDRTTEAAVQLSEDGMVKIASLTEGPGGQLRVCDLPATQVVSMAAGSDSLAREQLHRVPSDRWAAYPIGVLIVLLRACAAIQSGHLAADTGGGTTGQGNRIGQPVSLRGLRVFIRSAVPEGKGVSSSAALEVAVMKALAKAWEVSLEDQYLAHLCQCAENRLVGAPCGIMDQMTSALNRPGKLLALLCQPAEVRRFIPVPAAIRFWGIDSGVRHAVSGSDYTAVRAGTFMGYRMIAEMAGLKVSSPDERGVVTIDDSRWGGYLANLDAAEFAEQFSHHLPDEMAGCDFLARYGGTSDTVTRLDPQRTYPVRNPTLHPVGEHQRVRRFAELLESTLDSNSLLAMGQLMGASHASYSACGLGSAGTDCLVELVRQMGPERGLFGAKITGGGSGGTVAVLGRADAAPSVAAVAAQYTRATGREAAVFET